MFDHADKLIGVNMRVSEADGLTEKKVSLIHCRRCDDGRSLYLKKSLSSPHLGLRFVCSQSTKSIGQDKELGILLPCSYQEYKLMASPSELEGLYNRSFTLKLRSCIQRMRRSTLQLSVLSNG